MAGSGGVTCLGTSAPTFSMPTSLVVEWLLSPSPQSAAVAEHVGSQKCGPSLPSLHPSGLPTDPMPVVEVRVGEQERRNDRVKGEGFQGGQGGRPGSRRGSKGSGPEALGRAKRVVTRGKREPRKAGRGETKKGGRWALGQRGVGHALGLIKYLALGRAGIGLRRIFLLLLSSWLRS